MGIKYLSKAFKFSIKAASFLNPGKLMKAWRLIVPIFTICIFLSYGIYLLLDKIYVKVTKDDIFGLYNRHKIIIHTNLTRSETNKIFRDVLKVKYKIKNSKETMWQIDDGGESLGDFFLIYGKGDADALLGSAAFRPYGQILQGRPKRGKALSYDMLLSVGEKDGKPLYFAVSRYSKNLEIARKVMLSVQEEKFLSNLKAQNYNAF